MKVTSIIASLLTLACVPWLASCGSTDIMGDGVTDLTLQITVAGDVNPDDNGRASPVFLQVIELRDTSTFKEADYLGLYQDARSELGAPYINSAEIGPMYPNSTRTETLRLNPVTGAVGLLGEFNRYSDMQTSQSVVLDPGKDKKLNVLIDGSGVHFSDTQTSQPVVLDSNVVPDSDVELDPNVVLDSVKDRKIGVQIDSSGVKLD